MSEVHYSDLLVSSFEIGLTKLISKQIKEVKGYLSRGYGSEPVFTITNIVLEDDSEIGVEGEHDFPYLVMYPVHPQPNMDDETIERLYHEHNRDEGEEDAQ